MAEKAEYDVMLVIDGTPVEGLEKMNLAGNLSDGSPVGTGWRYYPADYNGEISVMLIVTDGTPYGVGVYTADINLEQKQDNFTPMTAEGGTV